MRLPAGRHPLGLHLGGGLTDVADAYLVDPTVAERVVVVSSLGSVTGSGGGMGEPNGPEDPWADTIVAGRLRYVQVSAFYDQLTDVPDSSLSQLPANPLGTWIAAKQPNLWEWQRASDQVGVAAVGIPGFATAVERVAAAGAVEAGAPAGPDLAADPNGSGWLVTACAGAVATAVFWKPLLDPRTYSLFSGGGSRRARVAIAGSDTKAHFGVTRRPGVPQLLMYQITGFVGYEACSEARRARGRR